jgi:hypothetical protein
VLKVGEICVPERRGRKLYSKNIIKNNDVGGIIFRF